MRTRWKNQNYIDFDFTYYYADSTAHTNLSAKTIRSFSVARPIIMQLKWEIGARKLYIRRRAWDENNKYSRRTHGNIENSITRAFEQCVDFDLVVFGFKCMRKRERTLVFSSYFYSIEIDTFHTSLDKFFRSELSDRI